jgi:hypothetical protein
MSLNPQTSINLKLIGGVVTICVSVIGAAWSGVNAIGKMVYDFAEIQTKTLEEIKNLKVEVHGDVVPSIDKLKDAVHVAETAAAAAKQRADDMEKEMHSLEGLAKENLAVSRSHSAAIDATLQAVTPKEPSSPSPP